MSSDSHGWTDNEKRDTCRNSKCCQQKIQGTVKTLQKWEHFHLKKKFQLCAKYVKLLKMLPICCCFTKTKENRDNKCSYSAHACKDMQATYAHMHQHLRVVAKNDIIETGCSTYTNYTWHALPSHLTLSLWFHEMVWLLAATGMARTPHDVMSQVPQCTHMITFFPNDHHNVFSFID